MAIETTPTNCEKTSSDKSSVMSWTKRGDWFFCLILAIVTILAYQPAWHGGLLWDDDNCTTPRELRSLDGLRRIWFQPRATAQYYPLLYTSYWVQQRLMGRFDDWLSLGQSSSAHRLCRAGVENPAFFANPGSRTGGNDLRPAPGECGNGGLDRGA